MINISKLDNFIAFTIDGKIDSNNIDDIEKEIYDYINTLDEDYKSKMIVFFNLENLDYISSAGLRLILKAKKEYNDVRVINLSDSLYEIFDFTGFTNMLTVRKKIKEISLDNLKLIGEGVTAKVYRMDDDKIIKLYNNGLSLYDIYKELDNAHKAFTFGVPTAIAYNIISANNCYGVIYELIDSKSVHEVMANDKNNIDKYVTEFANMLREAHSIELDDSFKSAKEIDISLIKQIPETYSKEKEILTAIYSKIPESNKFCHGDAHLRNALYQNGEMVFIDMATIAKGNPLFDFTSIYSIFVYTTLEPKACFNESDFSFTNEEKLHIFDKLIKVYFKTEDEEKIKNITEQIKMFCFAKLCLCMLTIYSELLSNDIKETFLNELHKYDINNLPEITIL